MCFSSSKPSAPPPPAAAPAPPSLPAEQQQIGGRRRRENRNRFGDSRGPQTRVDRSADTGTTGGSGVNSSGM